MKVLLVRHGPAGDKTEYAKTGRPDRARPLTPEGRKKMKKAALGLKRIVPRIDYAASSPLRRALQTAQIVGKAYKLKAPLRIQELVPGEPMADLVARIRSFGDG